MSPRFAAVIVSLIGFNLAMADSPADRWNLAELYPSVEAWNTDASRLEAQMKELAACKGHLGDNVARFRKCLELQADQPRPPARAGPLASPDAAPRVDGARHRWR